MKDKIQERINQVRNLATTASKVHVAKKPEPVRANDSLSKAIRNAKEADIFLAELDAAVGVAKTKKN